MQPELQIIGKTVDNEPEEVVDGTEGMTESKVTVGRRLGTVAPCT
jgi:hypothetical protein